MTDSLVKTYDFGEYTGFPKGSYVHLSDHEAAIQELKARNLGLEAALRELSKWPDVANGSIAVYEMTEIAKEALKSSEEK